MSMSAKKWWAFLIGVILLMVVGGLILIPPIISKQEELAKYPDRGLPRIDISLNGVTLEEIDNSQKETIYTENNLKLFINDEISWYDNIEIRLRGNGTLLQKKKPYRIKLQKKEDLLGLGRARKWNLLANYMDDTHLRTEASFYLSSMIGMDYLFDGRFVELYVDEEYRGLYYMTRSVEVSKEVVDLKSPLGLLVEIDNLYGYYEKNYISRNRELLTVKDVVEKENEEAAMKDFLNTFNDLELAIDEHDYKKVLELADVESFAEYYLLSEFTNNPDAYWTSFYLNKDGVDDKIHAGPGWDFDLTFSNRRWNNWLGELFHSPYETMVRKKEFLSEEIYDEMGIENGYSDSIHLSKLLFNLMEFSEFRELVRNIYQERLSGREGELVGYILKKADEIKNAVSFDNEKWEREDFESEVSKMIDWIRARYGHFEDEYGEKNTARKRNL